MKKVISWIVLIGSIVFAVFMSRSLLKGYFDAKKFQKSAVVVTGTIKSIDDSRITCKYDNKDSEYDYKIIQSFTVEYQINGANYTYSFKDICVSTFSSDIELNTDEERARKGAIRYKENDIISLSVNPDKPNAPRRTERVDKLASGGHLKLFFIFIIAFSGFFAWIGLKGILSSKK